MSLHNEIMNIAEDSKRHALMNDRERIVYKIGHRDARHRAAELSVIAEETIGELREALEECINSGSLSEYAMDVAQKAIAKVKGEI